MTEVRVRLYGGPFDGDRGIIDEVVPRLWAFPCPSPWCEADGVHWAEAYDDVPDGMEGAPYDYDEDGTDKDGFHVYVWAEMLQRSLERAQMAEVVISTTALSDAYREFLTTLEDAARAIAALRRQIDGARVDGIR